MSVNRGKNKYIGENHSPIISVRKDSFKGTFLSDSSRKFSRTKRNKPWSRKLDMKKVLGTGSSIKFNWCWGLCVFSLISWNIYGNRRKRYVRYFHDRGDGPNVELFPDMPKMEWDQMLAIICDRWPVGTEGRRGCRKVFRTSPSEVSKRICHQRLGWVHRSKKLQDSIGQYDANGLPDGCGNIF